MEPRISVITLGVADLARSLAFYRDGLGLPTKGIFGREYEHGAVAFFDLSGGLKLAIWAQDDIATSGKSSGILSCYRQPIDASLRNVAGSLNNKEPATNSERTPTQFVLTKRVRRVTQSRVGLVDRW